MGDLREDLSGFACGIVCGDDIPRQLASGYRRYSADTALEVYRNNYRGNLHDALSGAYPVIEQLVGRDFFRQMTRELIGRYPPRSANLHHYGEQMAGFVAEYEPARSLPYLPGVAELEWACHRAYFADDVPRLDIVRLMQVAPESYPELIFVAHPACHVVIANYPVAAIWLAHQDEACGDFNIDLSSGQSATLVSRIDDVVRVTVLSGAEADWLSKIKAGTTLGEATNATLEQYPGFDVQAALLMLASKNALADFRERRAS